MAGYSGTPLVKKLGLVPKDALTLVTFDAPDDYTTWLGALPAGLTILSKARPRAKIQAAHVFVTTRAALQQHLAKLRDTLEPQGFVWVSWPKKSAKVPTDVTEDTIREVCLPMGLVDVKVCAVTDVWSGLKLCIRKSERPGPSGA
jgi:hypothetical protein